MDNMWLNFALEIGFISFLGVLYYFYQKRKIIRYEENKVPMVMSFILQNCLDEKNETPQPKLDAVIEALDDYLTKKTQTPPLALIKNFIHSEDCPAPLKDVISEGLKELDE